VAQSLNLLGLVLHLRGQQDEALKLFEEALSIWRERLGPDAVEVGNAFHNIALVYRDRQDYKNGEVAAREDLRIRRLVRGDSHPETAAAITILAQILDARGDDVEAEQLLWEAKALREKIYGPDHPMATQAANNLASVIHDLGRYAEAEPLYRLAMEKNRARLGDHQDTAMNMNNLASLMEDWGRYDEAAKYFQDALDMRRRVFGADHPVVGRALNNSARFMYTTGHPVEALRLIDESIRIKLLTLRPDHIDVLQSRINRAAILGQLNRRADAEREFTSVIADLRTQFPAGTAVWAAPYGLYAAFLYRTGRAAEALPFAEASLALRAKNLPPAHWQVAQGKAVLGAVLAAQGRAAEGVPMLEDAVATLKKALPAGDWRTAEIEKWLATAASH
jgi:tetratricopeptide (TPR) repeat protein